MKRKIKIFTDETKSKDLQRKIKTHSTNKIETPPKRIKQISEIWRKEFLGNLHMMSRKKKLKKRFFHLSIQLKEENSATDLNSAEGCFNRSTDKKNIGKKKERTFFSNRIGRIQEKYQENNRNKEEI